MEYKDGMVFMRAKKRSMYAFAWIHTFMYSFFSYLIWTF
jgi:hypothetical protein